MRFDFQPALCSTKILKTTKQRKTFLLTSFSAVGFFIILSSLITNVAKNETQPVSFFAHNNQTLDLNTIQNQQTILPANATPEVKTTPQPNYLDVIATKPWQTINIQSGDTLSSLLKNLSISSVQLKDLTTFVKNNMQTVAIHIQPGQVMKVMLDDNNTLKAFRLVVAKNKTLCIDQIGPRNYKIYQEEKPIIKKLNFASNKITGSFFTAAQVAGLNDSIIMQMADIFGCDIDFVMDIRPNDRFRILYEEQFVENEHIGTGNILVAEFINQGRSYQAIRFTDPQGRSGYYSPEGYSMNKTFLRSPVKFSRISSRFSAGRHHPILHRMRAHKGVDYVAPAGTPIKAAADGKIVLIGKKGGYGNSIEIQHGSKYSTFYAHLSYFSPKLTKNSLVKQGQVIGYVGRTGLATGDHLHYEFRVEGIHRDPLTVQFPKTMPLHNHHRTKFLSHAQQMLSLLNENDLTIFAKK